MPYTPQDFTSLLGLSGFSENALATHFKLYEGYVANTNKIAEQLKILTPNSPETNELRRRFGWEFDGMRLHELYFESLTKEPAPLEPTNQLYQRLVANFGSYDAWISDFTATAMTRGIGWAILYYDEKADQLFNTFINEHDLGHLANCKIILNVDVFEHAFMIDYNTNRADYITACLNVLNWPLISGRL